MQDTQMTLARRAGALLAAAGFGLLSIGLPGTATAQSTVYVDGVVRDFLSSHPDFNISAFASTGHWAGAVGLGLVGQQQPGLAAAGFRVTAEWTERAGNAIAPHMYRDPFGRALRLLDPPEVDKDTTMDSWDPALGPYGPPLNAGPAPAVEVNSPMPVVPLPAMGPSVGDVFLQNIVTVSADIHCKNFTTKKDTIISIDGDVTILCDAGFVLGQKTTIALLPGATLTVYILGDTAIIGQGSSVNMNTWDPSRCIFYYLGSGTFDLNQDTQVCARIVAPDGMVWLHQSDQLYGSITARTARFSQTTGYHAETLGTPQDVCGVNLEDKLGTAGAAGNGQITSALTFAEWFSDVLGVNQSAVYRLTLTDDGAGVYEYLDDDFYPIDGVLLGNEGRPHNQNFTYTITSRFTYKACAGQFLSAQGGDGLWIFVGGRLVIDLAGVDYATDQYIDLDRLGLVDGEMYELRLFYASRNGQQPAFNFRTNALLISEQPPFNITNIAD